MMYWPVAKTYHLKIILFLALLISSDQFWLRRHHEEYFCEIIFEFGSVVQYVGVIQIYFLSRALVAFLFSTAKPFVQFW